MAAASSAPPHSPERTVIAADRVRTDRDGVTLEAALAACNIDIDRIGEAAQERRISLHILNCTSSKGRCWNGSACRWARCSAPRESNATPSPSTGRRPTPAQRPWPIAATRWPPPRDWRWRFARIATRHPDAVCTMGSVKTFPGIVTAVVGRCEATLDQRDLDASNSRRHVSRGAGGQPPLRRRRTLHGRVVAHLEHRADPLPSRADRPVPRGHCRDAGRASPQPSLRPAARRRRGRPRWAFPPR